MGSPPDERIREINQGPPHVVPLERIWVRQVPITDIQWHPVLEANPTNFIYSLLNSNRGQLPFSTSSA